VEPSFTTRRASWRASLRPALFAIAAAAIRELARSPRSTLRALVDLVTKSRTLTVAAKTLPYSPRHSGSPDSRGWRVRITSMLTSHQQATMACVASQLCGVPWSFTAHRWDIAEDNLLREKSASARFVRVIDERGKRGLARHARTANLFALRLGVAIPPAHHAKPDRDTLRVIIAARLVDVKGHRYALEALEQLVTSNVRVHLQCVGDGPLREELEAQTRKLGISKQVDFLGAFDHRVLIDALSEDRWDVALLSSIETERDWEGIPIFLVEAMAARIPVVATRTGGIPELLEDGAGWLIPQRDPGAIAAALTSLAHDPHARRMQGLRGFERVRATHDVTDSARALLAAMR
jgi:glycosyltransferase involved in cell wall biosynthesis